MDLDQKTDNPLIEEVYFQDYKPIEKDLITIPKHVLYLMMAVGVTIITLFAITRHLIKDLIHDLADFLFGKQPVEENVSSRERQEKFKQSWIPETSFNPEDMMKENETHHLMEDGEDLPSIWIISNGFKPCASPAMQKTGKVNKLEMILEQDFNLSTLKRESI